MKCTRHRCHVAPLSTVPIACFRPSWASEIDQPHALAGRASPGCAETPSRRPDPPTGPTSTPEHLPLALAGDADGDHRRLADHAPIDAHLVVRRIDPEVADARRSSGRVAKRRDHRVELAADPRHLRLRDRRRARAPSSGRRPSASRRRARTLPGRPPAARARRAGAAAAATGSTSPAAPSGSPARSCPPACPTSASGSHCGTPSARRVRSWRSAPIRPATSVSISACESTRMPSRSTSPSCSSRSLPTNADRSILGLAIVVNTSVSSFSGQRELTERCAMAASPVYAARPYRISTTSGDSNPCCRASLGECS